MLSSGLLAIKTTLTITAAVVTICICFLELYARYQARRLPPGISGLYSLFKLPRKKPWLKMLQFNQSHGDIASASLCGYNIIVIGSAKIAGELLGKRGINYADRPRSVMAGELAGWGKMMTLCNYTDRLRAQRKWVAHDLGSHAVVAKFHGMFEVETQRTLRSVLKDPDGLLTHLRKNFSSISLRLSYGYITKEGNDPLVELVELANSQLSKTAAPGANYVDVMPFLKYIPSWVPGAGFKKRAAEYAAVTREALETPHSYAVSQLAAGIELPSLSSRLLRMPDLTEELKDRIKWTTLTLYRGGVDATSFLSYAFYLAMTLYPSVMKKAQQELDSIVGTGELPTFADRSSLPYLEAVFTELLRWHSPNPITIRCTTEDDVYDGYLIPAKSYVMVNIWAMLRDERTYTDPLEFKPERFLGNDLEPDPTTVCFGFGRRRCPGLYIAESTTWLMCAQSLVVFDISKHVENGVEITPESKQVGGMSLGLEPFKCSIKPRSEAAERLVKEAF
ncbi:cytochrome P450 [Boletus coccyginus]|nr:cytochrome P450 [Boletus coccyginus]